MPSPPSPAESSARRNPTIIDVAQHAGVSKSVVSRVLTGNGGVSERAKAEVLRSVAALGYSSNAAAQALALGRTSNIGLLVRRSSSPYYGRLMADLQAHAAATGYRMVAATGNLDTDSEAKALQTLLELRVDGLIIGSGNLPTSEFQELSYHIPTVAIGREAAGSAADVVRVDSHAQARTAVHLLRSRGHRRVGLVTVPHSLSAQPRQAALHQAFTDSGVTLIDYPGSYDVAETRRAVQVLLLRPEHPTALLSLSMNGALAMLDEVYRRGLSVPADISVLALDEPLEAPIPGIAVSHIGQGGQALAQQAWELLTSRLKEPGRSPREVLVCGPTGGGDTLGHAPASQVSS